ncbi:MAG TPA: hypothetical protein VMZ30_00490, partial [Pyrinomonadaceae bacterium]|nr:hypothetical protein [Pyrinomonadaceae bacterium]
MALSEKTKAVLSWIIILVLIYIALGAIIFPTYWYDFFFRGRIFSPSFWLFGIRYILMLVIFDEPALLIVIALVSILGFLLFRFYPQARQLDIFRWNIFSRYPAAILLVCGVLIALLIYFAPGQPEIGERS